MPPLLQSQIAEYPCRRGKVRDVYDLGDRLVIIATDRISAFDWVLPTAIPDKGRILTSMTIFWFDFLAVPNHLMGIDVARVTLMSCVGSCGSAISTSISSGPSAVVNRP